MSGFRQSSDQAKQHSLLEIASGMENVEGMYVKENVTIKSGGYEHEYITGCDSSG